MTVGALQRERAKGVPVFVLGAGTLVSALAAGAFLVTYEGVGLIGYRTAFASALSVLLLIATIVAYVVEVTRGRLPRAAHWGIALAVLSYPAVFVLAMVLYAITGALGIYW
jgi:hypothetical protein